MLYLVCDLSGSMSENGKLFIMRNIVRTVDQFYRLNDCSLEMSIIAWSSEVDIEKWLLGMDVPRGFLECSGSLSGDTLIKKLNSECGTADYFLLLSDGYWSLSTEKCLNEWCESLPTDHLRIVKVGSDAATYLKGTYIFEAEELIGALTGWIL